MSSLIPVNFNNEIVITTKMLAEVYGCKEQQITQNFNYSQDKFEEKKHYYKLQGKELKEFKRVIENSDDPLYQEIKFASVLILWTKRGASRHCKMLGTDKAWDMFDSLEENYFNPKLPKLTEKQMLQLQILNGSELERVGALKQYEEVITKPLQETIQVQSDVIADMRPKALVGECLESSKDSILVRELAKILKQNDIDIGQNRLFEWLRDNGYLIKTGSDKNMPTQKAMNLKLFEVKHTTMICNGETKIRRTTMVTGKGVSYFVNKFKKIS